MKRWTQGSPLNILRAVRCHSTYRLGDFRHPSAPGRFVPIQSSCPLVVWQIVKIQLKAEKTTNFFIENMVCVHFTPYHFTPYHFTPHSFHPTFISPHIHFTPHSFHPTIISPHVHFTSFSLHTIL